MLYNAKKFLDQDLHHPQITIDCSVCSRSHPYQEIRENS